jgi:hypothetical protein
MSARELIMCDRCGAPVPFFAGRPTRCRCNHDKAATTLPIGIARLPQRIGGARTPTANTATAPPAQLQFPLDPPTGYRPHQANPHKNATQGQRARVAQRANRNATNSANSGAGNPTLAQARRAG